MLPPCARADGHTSAVAWSDYLEFQYLPWARSNLDPATLRARRGLLMILAEDLGATPLADVEILT